MRRLLGPLVAAVFLLSCVLTSSLVQAASRATLLSGVTATGNGTALDVGMSFVNGFQVVVTGSPSAVVVTLKASNDGTTFSTIGTFDLAANSSGDYIIPAQAKVQWIRADLDTLTAGTAPTVTVRAIYSDEASASAQSGVTVTGTVSIDQTTPGTTNGVVILDSTGAAVGWAAPRTGAVSTSPSSPVAVSASTVVWSSDATAREVVIRNPSTSTAGVACLFAPAAATVANATYEALPGQSITTGKDGYNGEIRCIAVSGTQTVSVTKISN